MAKSVTNACTHLVSSETGTKKCQDAEAKGVTIVDEKWIRDKIAGGGSGNNSPPSKKAATTTASASSASSSSEGVFSGIKVNVAGSGDFKASMEELIVSSGGTIVSMGECHYLVR